MTPGHDLDIDWLQAHDYWMRTGYLWVGVSAQRVGVEALKVWNAKRYGSLDVTHGGTITNDDLSYDIFAQAAQAVRAPGAVNIVGGLRVQRLFATGHSQSAGRLATYVNSVHRWRRSSTPSSCTAAAAGFAAISARSGLEVVV